MQSQRATARRLRLRRSASCLLLTAAALIVEARGSSLRTAGIGTAGAAQDPARRLESARAGLKIVVLEGEGAVNIVKQKTAVAPLVEVRDRNDQPVAGAIVRFAIQGGRASFGGPRTVVAATNAAGRAAVPTLTPTGSGAFQITATAAFQGQTAAVTIAQTNIISAAASGAGASGGAGAGAGGAAGGTGGGVSATTIGVIAGAVAGGTLVAKKLTGFTTYTGSISGDVVQSFTGGAGCAGASRWTGNMKMGLKVDGDAVTGFADVSGGSRVVTATNCTGCCQVGDTDTWGVGGDVQGTTRAFGFSKTDPFPDGISTLKYDFSGSLNGGTITGTLMVTYTVTPGGSGGGSIPVTLR